jgi:hypothetical protein
MTPRTWQRLGAVNPAYLVEARLQAHHAVQWLPRLVRAHVPPEPGFAHLAMLWDESLGGLVGGPVPAPAGLFRLGMRFKDLALVLRAEQDGRILGELRLHGHRPAEVEAWLLERLAELGLRGNPLSPPFLYDLPPHPVATGAIFDTTGQEALLAELARWFADSTLLLGLYATLPGAGPVRCWAHHFDLSVLIALGKGYSVGIGLSPGDCHYAEPYLYAYPWPCPPASAVSSLPAPVCWHTDGFTGAVLRACDLVRLEDQEVQVPALLDSMREACRLTHARHPA